jgi:twitching motility protein PilT
MDLDLCLRELERQSGSDLHLKAGRPPLFRIKGDLLPTDAPALSDDELRASLYAIMTEKLIKEFEDNCEADFSYEIEGLARFRVNMFVQRGHIGCVMRLIPLETPTVESLGLPKVLNTLADHENGLVLVTGPTGSGKSTTLAAMIEHVNQSHPVHIITAEDPIEFTYTDKVATINQRELGLDTGSLQSALRGMLREDPDIILMGEMRDPETIKFGITAAETGHLVFATLHTNDAPQTIERILDTMPPDARELIRQQLSLCLRGIVCQRLAKRSDGTGRVAAQEILVNTATISQLIAENKTKSIHKAMEEGSYYGMQTFNQALYILAQKGAITQDEALEKTDSPEDLRLMFRGVLKGTSAQEANDAAVTAGSGGGPEKKKNRGFDF